jgi:trehalose 6-phosphate phosphatase
MNARTEGHLRQPDPVDAIRRDPGSAAILLDFDGSLSEIVARPELATPVGGAREVLADLASRYAVVAMVSGRASEDLYRLLGVASVRYEGHYGRVEDHTHVRPEAAAWAGTAADAVPGAWVEAKGWSVAVHYRQAPDPAAARSALLEPLQEIARAEGLELIEGKMVLELVPAGGGHKGEAVTRLVRESGVTAAMFAGDDRADLDAFEALARLGEEGLAAVAVAVRGSETPLGLIRAADLVVEGPAGLVALLRSLLP